MDIRFDMSDFEQSLKDHADQFKLTPSKRLWNGIYNNLHPGSKWPSITVAIAFLITLVTIGNLNNSPNTDANNPVSQSKKLAGNETGKNPQSPVVNINSSVTDQATTNANDNNQDANKIMSPANSSEVSSGEKITAPKRTPAKVIDINSYNKDQSQKKPDIFVKTTSQNDADKIKDHQENSAIPADAILKNQLSSNDENITGLVYSNENIFTEELSIFGKFEPEVLGFINQNVQPVNIFVPGRRQKMIAKREAALQKKKLTSVEWIYFLSPAISSAVFRGNTEGVSSNPILFFPNQPSNGMIYTGRLGLKAGTEMNFKFSKKWKFISGFNLRYSGYNIVSNLVHPTFAGLVLRDLTTGTLYSKNYITHYGNGESQNQILIHNYNLQASVPVGLQYNIWQNENMQFNLASTFEFSTSLKSNAYIMSSDERYYLKDPSLMRKLNLGASFHPNIILNATNIKWHIGPDFHYQILSTYKNNYQIKEHLIDYGIRIGISK